jgi:divalent metal cation (Fe/Co/Zn/Cd) transporter
MRPTKELLPIIWSVGLIYLLAKSKIYQLFSVAIIIALVAFVFFYWELALALFLAFVGLYIIYRGLKLSAK